MSTRYVLSATQIETFLLCKRKWALQYLEGQKPPSTKAQELGSNIHKALFNYLSNHTIENSPLGQIIKPGLVFLPTSLPKENLESHFAYAKDGHIFQGYMDFYEQLDCSKWLLGDHKTCSDFARILNSDELKKNIQANIYAQYFFTQKDAQFVDLRWIYYRTKGTPKAICVDAVLSKEEAEINFKSIKAAADEIVKIIKDPTSNNWPQNRSACFIFGKCHFFNQCRQSEVYLKMEENKVLEKNFHLYIDCVPLKSQVDYDQTIDLSELLKPVFEKIRQEKNLSHYRFIGYGQYVGLISEYLSDHLIKNPLNNSVAVLSTAKTPEGSDTLTTLSSLASKIVRGFQ